MDAHAASRWPGAETIPDEELLDLRRLILSWAARSGADPDDAEDVAQDVLWRVVRSCSRFRGASRLSSWTYRIAHNVLVTRAQRSEVQSRAEARFSAGVSLRSADPSDGILGAIEAREVVRHWLQSGILTRTELELITMTSVQGFPSESVGARFGCRPGTVRSRVSRAIARVRGQMSEAA